MTYRAPHYGPWGQGLRAPRRRECRSRASFCHEHRPRISLPWQPCRTPEGLIALLRCSAARLVFCEASPEGSVRWRDVPWLKDQAAFLEPPASTSTPIKSLSFMIMYSTPSSLTSVPDHLPNSTRSPTLTSIGMFSAMARRSVAEGSGGLSRTSSFHQHPHQVAFFHDHVLDAVELDFSPRPLAEQHSVADLDVDRDVQCDGETFRG